MVRSSCGERGFTVLELLIVLFVVSVLITGLFWVTIGVANVWTTEAGALRCVQVINPKAVRVVDLQRGVWGYTVVIVEEDGGARSRWNLDTNVFANKECSPRP